MAGIYLHIPFCRQACHYCNFHFSTSLARKNDFISALLKEIPLRRDYLAGESVETVYLGGGTPSLLAAEEIESILDALRSQFPLSDGAEITLEANPDDITTMRLGAWRQAGVNRLSIGVQSFFEEDLRWMNRAHTAPQALDCIRQAREAGFDNLSIDLIYGGPTLPDARWQENVERAIGLGIPHLSCYALTVEPKTALDTLIRRHAMADVSPEDQARQFLLLMDWMAGAGYDHYEISNFALPGHRSRHNSAYWQGKKYLGLGPSAHSYDGVSREWNIANNARYIAEPGLIGEKEVLTAEQRLNEYIMIALRTVEGIDLRVMAERFGVQRAEELRRRAEKYVQGGAIRVEAGRLRLTREGKLLADGIASDLFV
ncbi:MAG TPA: radical SAM family heme chaperone HemW [Puia sp.]|uniref:radical SAM family heme chaperone HemW n=1 Tax=Puia sp. TaxID=2045100 RepID=UPI002C362E80|nr:radical SAM family heme chaperone HemW [Puia sp.]HVU99001.1 radical SAM family heme chaperone HemW [Puia sp.]